MGHIRVGRWLRSAAFPGIVALSLVLALACDEFSDGESEGMSGAGSGGAGGGGGSSTADGATDGPGEGGPSGDCGSDPADDVCTACLKSNCCTEWKTCRAEQACTTCTNCMATEQDLGKCNFSSGTCAFMSTGDPTARMLSCGLTPCEVECGFS